MTIPSWLEKGLQRGCDWLYTHIPQPLPSPEQLEKCKIISHRGEHDNRHVYENSLEAFARLVDQGVWGIEFDIRWTKDLVPVVFHDADCRRLFASDTRINAITAKELKTHFPQIPMLTEVVEQFGKKLHFMIEIKTENYPDPVYQSSILEKLLNDLEPKADYHFISLNPEMFSHISFVDNDFFLPVAELNVRRLSELTHEQGYGGLTGHYLLLNNSIVEKNQKEGKQTGTGFVTSKNCLCRELNRGVEWIFTNDALKLAAIRKSLLPEITL